MFGIHTCQLCYWLFFRNCVFSLCVSSGREKTAETEAEYSAALQFRNLAPFVPSTYVLYVYGHLDFYTIKGKLAVRAHFRAIITHVRCCFNFKVQGYLEPSRLPNTPATVVVILYMRFSHKYASNLFPWAHFLGRRMYTIPIIREWPSMHANRVSYLRTVAVVRIIGKVNFETSSSVCKFRT